MYAISITRKLLHHLLLDHLNIKIIFSAAITIENV